MPLLCAAAGLLSGPAETAWSAHPVPMNAFGATVAALQHTESIPLAMLRRAHQRIIDATVTCHEAPTSEDEATQARLDALCQRDGASRASLRNAIQLLMPQGGHMSPMLQESLLFLYGGDSAGPAAALFADQLRRHRTTDQTRGSGASSTDAAAPAHATATSLTPHPPLGSCYPDFHNNPDGEVTWWVDMLVRAEKHNYAELLRQIPPYTQFIMHASLDSILDGALTGIRALQDSRLSAADASDLPPVLSTVLPLPVAVVAQFSRVVSGKPEYFVVDMATTPLASVLHKGVSVQPMATDASLTISPRFSSTPTAESAAGKSPTFALIETIFLDCMRPMAEFWRFANTLGGHIYSDGSHGGFNEKMRQSLGTVAFMSSEATNQLAPEYHTTGRIDKKEFTDIKKLLECLTGGRYRWTTATEERQRATRTLQRSRAGEPDLEDAAGTTSRQRVPEPSVFDQAINFEKTNVNICFLQQTSVFRDWWVAAEARRKLGFIGGDDQ